MSRQPPEGEDSEEYRPPYPAPRDPLPPPLPAPPRGAMAQPAMTWSAQTETFLQAVERAQETPVLIRLEEGWRGHVEQLSLSSGDVMALEGCTVVRGSRVVMAHYMENMEDEEGVPVLDGVQRALLTIPLSSLPDVEVSVMVDPEGEMYHNFVDGNFGECSWRRQKEELLEDLESEDADEHDYINEITVIDLKTRARKPSKKKAPDVTVPREAKGRPPTPPPKPHHREGSPAATPPPPRPPRKPASIHTSPTPVPRTAETPISSRPLPIQHRPTPPLATAKPHQERGYGIYSLSDNDRLSQELQNHNFDLTIANLNLHQCEIMKIPPANTKEKSKSAPKGRNKVKNPSTYVKMKKLLSKKPKKHATTPDEKASVSQGATAATFIIAEEDNENDDDNNYVEIDDDYVLEDDENYTCVKEIRMAAANTTEVKCKKAAGKKGNKKDCSSNGPQQSPEEKPTLIVLPLGARPRTPEEVKAARPMMSAPSEKAEPPMTTITSPLRGISCSELCERLVRCGLPALANVCKDNVIDGTFFVAIDESAFKNPPFCCQNFEVMKVHMIKSGWVPNEDDRSRMLFCGIDSQCPNI